ncbi:MAG: TonB-dependent receptor [Magnetococcales bacterium]|nr:TonB-dependent receptor [Magnetococcales bacterium]MBF0115809.1 TonB-dependent receptor [Magnetococcales bacterium]
MKHFDHNRQLGKEDRRAGVLALAVSMSMIAGMCMVEAVAEENTAPENAVPTDANAHRSSSGTTVLDTVVVSATRDEIPLKEVSAAVNSVGREAFQESQARSVGEVLERLPGVAFGGGARPDAQIPTIRGEYGRNIVTLIDGARNNATDGNIWSALVMNPEFLSGAEVVRGSASSLYGSGGMGGVLSLRTLSAADLLQPGQRYGTELKESFHSANRENVSTAKFFGKEGAFDGLLALGYDDWGRIRLGDGNYTQPNDGHMGSLLAKAGWEPSNRLRVELTHQYDSKDMQTSTNPQVSYGFTFNTVAHITHQNTVLKATSRDGQNRKELEGTIYYNENKRDFEKSTSVASASTFEVDTLGGSLQHSLDLGEGKSHRLTYGLDAHQDVQEATSGGIPNTITPDGKQRVLGAFVQDEIKLVEGWVLTPSARMDRFEGSLDNGSYPDVQAERISPKLALSWQMLPQVKLYTSYGEAFRAPTLSEMYTKTANPATSFTNFTPNPDLKPEVGKTAEVGFRTIIKKPFAQQDRLNVSGNLYHTQWSNRIESVSTVDTAPGFPNFNAHYINVANAERNGGELEVGYDIAAWTFQLAYSQMRTKDMDTNKNLFSPPDKWTGQVRYGLTDYDLSVQWSSMLVADQDYDSTVARRIDGYDVHDLYASWTPSPMWRVDMGVANLFDNAFKTYSPTSVVFPRGYEEGRSFRVALTGNF